MPRVQPPQNSFNAGEWSSILYGRTDLDKWHAACKLLRNFIILPQGGVQRRSGTRFVAEVKSSDLATRLWPFVFSDEQAYVLEFGDRYIRVFRDEGQLLLQPLSGLRSSEDISTTTSEFTRVGHGYRDGDGPVRISTDDTLPAPLTAVDDYFIRTAPTFTVEADATTVDASADTIDLGLTHQLQDDMGPYRMTATVATPGGLTPSTDYYVLTTADPQKIQLAANPGGGAINITSTGTGRLTLEPTGEYQRNKFRLAPTSSGVSAYALTSAGSGLQTITPQAPVGAVEITTPYRDEDLDGLSFAQSADTLYVAHKNYPPHKLERFSPQGFWLSEIEFIDGPYLEQNTDSGITLDPTATTGSGETLTASEAMFKGSDVGRLVRLATGVQWGYARIVSVSPIDFTDADVESFTFVAGDVATDPANTITNGAGHGMDTGELVRLVGAGLPTGLSEGVDYYVQATSATVLKFHPTRADAVADTNWIVITVAGAGRVTSSVLDIASHGYTGGEGPLQMTNSGGSLPTGYTPFTNYFIGYVDANSVTLSLTRGGTALSALEPTGGGTHTLHGDDVPQASCTIDILANFSTAVATSDWRLGAWSAAEDIGFPRSVSFHEQRLWWAANVDQPQTVWGGKSGDFESHSPTGDVTTSAADLDDTIDEDNAITYTMGSNQVNVIHWLNSLRTMLMGTSSAAWTAAAALQSEAISPTNLQVRRSFQRGSKPAQPVTVDNRTLYVSQTGNKLFSLGYAFESDDYIGEDLNLLAEHITRGGIDALDYAPEPWSNVVTVRADGVVPVLTLIRDQEIMGWARWEIGGSAAVRSVAVIPAPDGDASSTGRANQAHDQIWLLVERTINGETKQYVEFVEDHFESGEGTDPGDVIEDAFFVDAGLTYNSTPTTTISGLDHLEGEEVDALADGIPRLALTVSSGTITLPEAASKVHVGYGFDSDIETLRLAIQDNEGSAETKLGRLDHVVLRLNSTLGGKMGPDADSLDSFEDQLIPHDIAADTISPPFSGDIELAFDGPWETEGVVYVRQDLPLPMTVLAIVPHLQKGGRGMRR